MSTYEATFAIDSRSDAEAVRIIAERAHNALREELMDIDDSGPHEMLAAFEAIRDAARESRKGTLTIRYEQRDESFDG